MVDEITHASLTIIVFNAFVDMFVILHFNYEIRNLYDSLLQGVIREWLHSICLTDLFLGSNS